MTPTEILEQEHRVIERVLSCLEAIAGRDPIDVPAARDAIDFLRNFADRCHHGKEEDRLFPLMEARGVPAEGGPTSVMRHEHEIGRELIGRMAAAVEEAGTAGGEAFAEAARAYVALLREHIRKEDHCLFPIANRALRPEDQQELARRFDEVDRVEIGAETRERYLRMADTLAARLGVTIS